jgi:hypothetical protein
VPSGSLAFAVNSAASPVIMGDGECSIEAVGGAVTGTVPEAVAVAPSSSVTVSLTSYAPFVANVWLTVLPVASMVLSPSRSHS